ncbi:MAG: hypothetical protein ACLFNO_02960 [Parcubacteria group bacterium]
MSIKEKFEAIKKDSEIKKTVTDIAEDKEVLHETLNQQQVLTARINDLKSLVSQLKDSYRTSESSLEDFKKSAANIKELYSEYKDYLNEKGIDSVEEILHSDDFQEDAEVKEYHESGAAQIDETGKRGNLGESVEGVAKAKTAIKEALPDMNLDFKGKKKSGEEMSPREISISKIEDYISELETELEETNKKESEKKDELLPKLGQMISLELDKIFSQEDLNLNPQLSNKKFINDKVLELGGDVLWSQIKEKAKEQIQKTIEEKHAYLHISDNDIDSSLEAEKFIYDVDKIKEEHEDLLELKSEEEGLKRVSNEINADYFLKSSGELMVKDNKLFRNDLMEKVDYFKEKNVEAKKVCEDVINEYLSAYKAAKEKMPSGLLIGKKTKEEVKEMTAIIDEAIEKMQEIKVPDNFYCEKPYEFTNKLLSIPPHFDINLSKNSSLEIKKDLIDLDIKLSEQINELRNKESGSLSKLINDLYHVTGRKPTTEMSGFNVPYTDSKNLYSYKELKNTEKVDDIFKKVDGLKLSHEDFIKLFTEERENLTNQIADYPDSEKILNKIKELKDEFDNNYKSKPLFIQRKIAAKEGREVKDYDKKESYELRKDLFNN